MSASVSHLPFGKKEINKSKEHETNEFKVQTKRTQFPPLMTTLCIYKIIPGMLVNRWLFASHYSMAKLLATPYLPLLVVNRTQFDYFCQPVCLMRC